MWCKKRSQIIIIQLTRWVNLVSLLFIISGCTLFPRTQPALPQVSLSTEQRIQAFKQHTNLLANFNTWTLTGRVGVKSPQGAYAGNLKWTQNQDHFSINISGPLGQGTTSIQGNAEEVTLTEGKTGQTNRGDPTSLMNQALGWSLPIHDLTLWIKGHPGTHKVRHNFNRGISPTPHDTQVSDIKLNNGNTLSLLQHADWRIEYHRYQTGAGNIPLPYKVVASNSNLKLTFIIKNWSELSL